MSDSQPGAMEVEPLEPDQRVTKDPPSTLPPPSGLRSSGPARRLRSKSPVKPPKPLVEGAMLGGKYKLVCKMAEGGMGSLWEAHNEALDIRVALKVLRPQTLGDAREMLADRMVQEARSAARLGHPAIVRISDFGRTDDDDPFIVMELLKGEDLASSLARRGNIDEARAIQTLLPIADALSAAHDKGIVHRDIKPENIFLALREGSSVQPKLIDFGVAKLNTGPDARLTSVGAVLGSPAYMSPEQARGLDVDQRADIFSFSVVLYELISGTPPFDGDNYNALLRSIIEDPPRPLTELYVGDDELWEIIETGLAKDPAMRWQTFREYGSALAEWLVNNDVTEDICGQALESTWIRPSTQFHVDQVFDKPALPPMRRPLRSDHRVKRAPRDLTPVPNPTPVSIRTLDEDLARTTPATPSRPPDITPISGRLSLDSITQNPETRPFVWLVAGLGLLVGMLATVLFIQRGSEMEPPPANDAPRASAPEPPATSAPTPDPTSEPVAETAPQASASASAIPSAASSSALPIAQPQWRPRPVAPVKPKAPPPPPTAQPVAPKLKVPTYD